MTTGTDREDGARPDLRHQAGVALDRRRLLHAGLSAAPVVMTLASGPVSAGMCTTASAYGSMNPSSTRANTSCGGRSPTAWSTTQANGWPRSLPPTSKFEGSFTPALARSVNFKKVIDPTGGYDLVASHCVAALLNASSSPSLTPPAVLSAATAKSIWASYATKGYYEPTAGIRWNSGQIVDWIKTTYS